MKHALCKTGNKKHYYVAISHNVQTTVCWFDRIGVNESKTLVHPSLSPVKTNTRSFLRRLYLFPKFFKALSPDSLVKHARR